jgi:hypothetical protein
MTRIHMSDDNEPTISMKNKKKQKKKKRKKKMTYFQIVKLKEIDFQGWDKKTSLIWKNLVVSIDSTKISK